MERPILSIIIPTYNRAKLLVGCLESILMQLNNHDLNKKVEIILSDNASSDNTKDTIKNFSKKFPFIHYFRNRINVGGDINLFLGSSHAKGRYIWFFSDDDAHMEYSIKTVLGIISRYAPDVALVNMDLYSKDMKTILDRNLFRNSKDIYVKTKKEYFSYLETKFFLPFDWHIGVYSNTIVSRKLFNKNGPKVLIFNGSYNQFAHSSLFYYFPDDYKIYIAAKPLVKFRADNRAFGPKDRLTFLRYWYPILDRHYQNITNINKKNISTKFLVLLALKKMIRNVRVFSLGFFKTDVAGLLMKLFYKDEKGKRKNWSISV